MTSAEVAVAAAERLPERPGGKLLLWRFLHLTVLSSFALAQPLFDLLGDNPEFFAARGSPGFDVISFAVLVTVLPPALLAGIELLAGLTHRRAADFLHLAFVALGVLLIAAQALKKSIDASDAVLIAVSLAIGAAAAVLYARAEVVRSFLSVLSPAPLVFLVLFLFFSPVQKLAFPDEAGAQSIGGVAGAPIVVVLFDELPTTTLMDGRRRIDGDRFPGFGELAADATWFRNAFTIYDSTSRAQPAIMDGNYPSKDKLPTASDHPNSIFSLFGGTHRLNVSEEATTVCSRDLCEDARLEESYGSRLGSMTEDLGLVWLHVVSPPGIESGLASVSENWGNFGGGEAEATADADPDESLNVRANLAGDRQERFDSWIESIEPGDRPALHFKHTLLPHVPWQYLPSGKLYRHSAFDAIPGMSNQSYRSQDQLDSLYQRHMLQTGFADRLLGKLLRRLKESGLYHRSLIVVASDHGLEFSMKRERRRLTRENAGEIAPIPLLVKAPNQRKPAIDDAYVESVDILPTMLDLLDVRGPRTDGKSAFSDEVQNRDRIRIFDRASFEPIVLTPDEFEDQKEAQLQKKLALFGSGADGPLRLYRIGPNQELLGRPTSELEVVDGSGSAELADRGAYRYVERDSALIPAHVVGRLSGLPPGRELAIAVNGTVRAVSSSFQLATNDEVLFAAMVPELSFRPGANRIEVFEVTASGTLARL